MSIIYRDSLSKNPVLGTGDVNTQWRQVLAWMNTGVICALSPPAQGKIVCLHHTRTADGDRKTSIGGHSFQIPGMEPREDVDLHVVADETKNLVETRIWAAGKLVYTTPVPIATLQKTVHFSSFPNRL